MSIVNRHTIN